MYPTNPSTIEITYRRLPPTCISLFLFLSMLKKLQRRLLIFLYTKFWNMSRVVQLVKQWATDWKAGVLFLEGARDFSQLHSVQTGSGAHTASYPMGIRGTFPGGKAAGL
jgi:hypothetical protein